MLTDADTRKEEEFLRYIRSLYIPRKGGIQLTPKNARGRGGRHVLGHALRIKKRTAYDEIAVFVDTDQDWNTEQRERAKKAQVHTLESSPCIEAWLLDVNGHKASGNSKEIKQTFRKIYRSDAHDPSVYPRHFSKSVVDAARPRIAVLHQLLTLLRVL